MFIIFDYDEERRSSDKNDFENKKRTSADLRPMAIKTYMELELNLSHIECDPRNKDVKC